MVQYHSVPTFLVPTSKTFGEKLHDTFPQTNSSPLKNGGWETSLSFWVSAYFQGQALSFGEGIWTKDKKSLTSHFHRQNLLSAKNHCQFTAISFCQVMMVWGGQVTRRNDKNLPTSKVDEISIYLSIHPSIHLSIHPSIYLPIYLSTYLSIYLSTYLSTYLSIYLVYPEGGV